MSAESLRDQIAKECATVPRAKNPVRAYEKADAILDLLRAHRDETLEALGGREEMRRRDRRYMDEPCWLFDDCEPERGSMMARHRREWELKYGKDMETGEPIGSQ